MAGCAAPMMGGKRRKSKKAGKKSRKMKGGVMYGPTQAITPGALQWGSVDTSAPMRPDGTMVADPFGTSGDSNAKITGGRRRTRKGAKKSKSRKTRKMKGGAGVYNVGPARAEFVGNPGVNGPLTYGQYASVASKVGGYGPTAGADGVMKA